MIVEYANQLREQGLSIVPAAIKAGQERFRPILMTAISSLVGFWSLVVAVDDRTESELATNYQLNQES